MRVRLILAAVTLLSFSAVSRASTLNFSVISGADTASFQLASNPTPSEFIEGNFTEFDNVAVTFDGTTMSDDLIFGNGTTGITLVTLDGSLFFLGPQLYTGLESAPMFAAGTVDVSTAGGDPASISITGGAASVTPEPSSLLLLSTGMLGLAGIVKRRFA